MAEKKHQEEDKGESAPLWVISFLDLVMIMLAFFVIMAAGNPQDVKMDPEFTEVVAAVKEAFHYLPPADSTDPVDVQIVLNQLRSQKGRGGAGKRGDAILHSEGAVGKHDQVSTVRLGSQITMGGYVRFARASTELRPESIQVLEQIVEKVRGHTNVFVIKGHCSKDEEQEAAGAGRDLGYERASRVVDKLAELGLSREALRVQSCRDFEPIKEAAYSDEELAVNRRVEIVATESLIQEYKGQPGESESAGPDRPESKAPPRPAEGLAGGQTQPGAGVASAEAHESSPSGPAAPGPVSAPAVPGGGH